MNNTRSEFIMFLLSLWHEIIGHPDVIRHDDTCKTCFYGWVWCLTCCSHFAGKRYRGSHDVEHITYDRYCCVTFCRFKITRGIRYTTPKEATCERCIKAYDDLVAKRRSRVG